MLIFGILFGFWRFRWDLEYVDWLSEVLMDFADSACISEEFVRF